MAEQQEDAKANKKKTPQSSRPPRTTFLDVQLCQPDLIPKLRSALDFEEWELHMELVHSILIAEARIGTEQNTGLQKLTLAGLASLKRDSIIKDKVVQMAADCRKDGVLTFQKLVEFVREACKEERGD